MHKATIQLVGLFAVGATLAAGCSQPQRPVAPSPAATPAEPVAKVTEPAAAQAEVAESNPKSPMTANLVQPTAVPATGEINLGLEVWRVNPAMAPIKVTVELPAGARLVGGSAAETITDTQAQEFKRTWRIAYATIPAADAKVIVDWQTDAAGFHAELPYRFGRAEPKRTEPPRLPEVRLPGGQSLGRPILTGSGGK